MTVNNGTHVGYVDHDPTYVDHDPTHRHCARKIRALTILLRLQRSALRIIAGFSDDPKIVNVARRALGEARW